MISSTLSCVLYSFPNRRPLDCADETVQEEVKVMFESLGESSCYLCGKQQKVPDSTKRNCSFNKDLWHLSCSCVSLTLTYYTSCHHTIIGCGHHHNGTVGLCSIGGKHGHS